MAQYAVKLLGENFLMDFEEATERIAFEVVRYVEADDEDGAEIAAMDLIRERLESSIRNDNDDPPVVYIEEVAKMDTPHQGEQPGFLFLHE